MATINLDNIIKDRIRTVLTTTDKELISVEELAAQVFCTEELSVVKNQVGRLKHVFKDKKLKELRKRVSDLREQNQGTKVVYKEGNCSFWSLYNSKTVSPQTDAVVGMILEDWRKQKQQEEAKRILEEEVKKTALATLEETKNHYDIERETMPAAKLQTKSLLDYAKLSGVTYTENRKELLRYFAHMFHLSQDLKEGEKMDSEDAHSSEELPEVQAVAPTQPSGRRDTEVWDPMKIVDHENLNVRVVILF
jgi:hypothetical protein